MSSALWPICSTALIHHTDLNVGRIYFSSTIQPADFLLCLIILSELHETLDSVHQATHAMKIIGFGALEDSGTRIFGHSTWNMKNIT